MAPPTTISIVRDRGDFQTPGGLASAVARIAAKQFAPAAIVEPTCGRGSLLAAALDRFPGARGFGLDINAAHLEACRNLVGARAELRLASFFDTDWKEVLGRLPDPLLVIGNPPWVTSASLSAMGSANVPTKTNKPGVRGIDAITGASNFDISEWMLRHVVEQIASRDAVLAMLCKSSVARKVLQYVWENELALRSADLYPVDASAAFGASVDACLLVCRFGKGHVSDACCVYEDLEGGPVSRFGFRGGKLVADLDAYEAWGHLAGGGTRWRSGIKHDCARVMELRPEGNAFRNGLGERVRLEADYLFPMLKSSELVRGKPPSRVMLVPQRSTSEDTAAIAEIAPKTWRYLQRHRESLDRRASSIYRNRPPFSVFGVGEYSFAPWKVAISGFYKSLQFTLLGPHHGKPVVLDDTAYFVACTNRAEAREMHQLLQSEPAQSFYRAFVFWDAKRPITAKLLGSLDLRAARLEAQ